MLNILCIVHMKYNKIVFLGGCVHDIYTSMTSPHILWPSHTYVGSYFKVTALLWTPQKDAEKWFITLEKNLSRILSFDLFWGFASNNRLIFRYFEPQGIQLNSTQPQCWLKCHSVRVSESHGFFYGQFHQSSHLPRKKLGTWATPWGTWQLWLVPNTQILRHVFCWLKFAEWLTVGCIAKGFPSPVTNMDLSNVVYHGIPPNSRGISWCSSGKSW